LNQIEYLINEDIPAQLKKSPMLSQRFISQAVNGRMDKPVALDREFLSLIKQSTNEETIRIAVRDWQYRIVSLLDKLVQWLPENEVCTLSVPEPEEDPYYLFKYLHRLLYGLHHFMEKRFFRYIDQECKIPAYSVFLRQTYVTDVLDTIRSSPRFRALDTCLQQVVSGPLEMAISPSADDDLTFRDWDYVVMLAKQLLEFVDKGNDDVCRLHNRLQYIDFNSHDYLSYLTAQLSEECSAITNHKERYIWLIERRKNSAHQLVEGNLSYQTGTQSLKAMLDEWLQWEIYYAKKMMALETAEKKIC
jgi:hypothetical protein